MTKLTVENYMNILKEDYAGRRIQWKREVSKNYKMSEELIELLDKQNKINWEYISLYQTLSEEFIDNLSDRVVWWSVSRQQILSEEFIKKNSDKVDWGCISQHQIFSVEFFIKNKEYINVFFLILNKKLPDSFWKDIRIKIFFSKQEEDVKAQYLKKLKEMK